MAAGAGNDRQYRKHIDQLIARSSVGENILMAGHATGEMRVLLLPL